MKRQPRIVRDIAKLAAEDLAALDHRDHPFLSHAFLHALESSGCVTAQTGWQVHHLCLFENDSLVAFAPSYLKSHSHGEFVFDWAWADAYQRHNRRYYPKLLTAVPYSPIPGPRLLVRRDHPYPEQLREELVALAVAQCEELDLSSWHCNFIDDNDVLALETTDLLPRGDWQFHWFNRGYGGFEDFVASLRSKKRKNLLRDRRLVTEAGVRFVHKSGADLNSADLDFLHACYQQTFLEHGNHPALNRDFFGRLAKDMPDQVLAVFAMRDEEPLAMSFFLVGGGRLYGRYWGCMEYVPGLHFETAYHQGIEYCISHKVSVFEPGAQGEHKISRGFTPIKTHSFHLVRDPLFRAAIANYLQSEKEWMQDYRRQLAEHDPFRSATINP